MDWKRYLSGGYFDDDDRHRREIYIEWAREVADELGRGGMTSASLRRFYGKIKALQRMLTEETFLDFKHHLYSVLTMAHYGNNREERSGKLPDAFVIFLERNIQLAERSYKDFLAFVDHFQSVVAYFKETNKKLYG